jgi:hypothetical protein
MSRLLLQVPLPLREAVYDMVAANRYSWFGRSKVCQVRRGCLHCCSVTWLQPAFFNYCAARCSEATSYLHSRTAVAPTYIWPASTPHLAVAAVFCCACSSLQVPDTSPGCSLPLERLLPNVVCPTPMHGQQCTHLHLAWHNLKPCCVTVHMSLTLLYLHA